MLIALLIILVVVALLAFGYKGLNSDSSATSSSKSNPKQDDVKQLAQDLVETTEVPVSLIDRQKEYEELRDKIVAQDGLTSLWRIKFEVKGGTYRSEAAQDEYICLTPGNELKLKPEPDNEHDEYAVRVYSDRKFIGYVDRKHSRAVSYVLEQFCAAECLVWDNSFANDIEEPEMMEACLFISSAFRNEERVRGFIPPIDKTKQV